MPICQLGTNNPGGGAKFVDCAGIIGGGGSISPSDSDASDDCDDAKALGTKFAADGESAFSAFSFLSAGFGDPVGDTEAEELSDECPVRARSSSVATFRRVGATFTFGLLYGFGFEPAQKMWLFTPAMSTFTSSGLHQMMK